MLSENTSLDITRWLAYFRYKGAVHDQAHPPKKPQDDNAQAFPGTRGRTTDKEGSLDELRDLTELV